MTIVRRSRGFTITEMMVVLIVLGMMASAIASYLNGQQQDARGKAIGEIAVAAHDALEDYGRRYKEQVVSSVTSSPEAITGVAVVTAPTLAELLALGFTTRSIDPVIQRSGTLTQRVSVIPAGCTPPSCALSYLTYISAPTLDWERDRVAGRVLAAATRAAGARAGTSEAFAPDRIRGLEGQWDAANPVVGAPVGIFALISASSDLGQDAFVRIRDTRDPNLQGNLTVANTIAGGTLSVTNTAVIGGTLTVTNNTFVGGTLSTNNLNVTQSAVFGGPVNINNNLNVTGTLTVQQNISATGSVTGDRLVATGSYGLLTACPVAEEGAIARRLGGNGMVVCIGGFWRAVATQARDGDACAPEGTRATDPTNIGLVCIGGVYRRLSNLWRAGTPGQACTAAGISGIDVNSNNEALICRSNPGDPSAVLLWFRMRDMTQHLQFVTAVTALGDGALIAKPTCNAASGGAAPVPQLRLIPKAYSSDDGGFHTYGEDYSSTYWVVRFRDGSGAVQPGQPAALAELFCYYP